MKKTCIQIGIGFLPILLGFCFYRFFPISLFLVNLLFFILWAWLCFWFCDPDRSVLSQLLRVCLPGAVVLIPALWLELSMNTLPALLTGATQFYFLSGVSMAGRILTPFLRIITAWPYYIVSYLCMSLVCLLAMILKRKVIKKIPCHAAGNFAF